MITWTCPEPDCEQTYSSMSGLFIRDARKAHQKNCPTKWGINFLKEKTR